MNTFLKALAVATKVLAVYYIYAGIGGYHNIGVRDILAHVFLCICCGVIYVTHKSNKVDTEVK